MWVLTDLIYFQMWRPGAENEIKSSLLVLGDIFSFQARIGGKFQSKML